MYDIFTKINGIITLLFAIFAFYRIPYFIIGIFWTRKFKSASKKHKYGIVIAARNEEKVIGNLLDSIKKQDYPHNKYDVFVVADNCTDNTAKIAKNNGAIVYERFDNDHRTKGYALEYLFDQIKKDYGIEKYEAYIIFDADNLLKENYLIKMNDAYDSGAKIITSYRNTKNYGENWIASTYGIHWMRSIRTLHRARSVLHLATNIQGTGFLISNEIVKNGWHYTSLTEDRALTADAVAQGYEITYQNEAEFYDEQPTDLKTTLKQRLRWSRGHLEAFLETGPYLFLNIFLGKKYIKKSWNKQEDDSKNKIIESIRHRFASFDTLIQLTPISIISFMRWFILSFLLYGLLAYNNGLNNTALFNGASWLVKLLNGLFPIKIALEPGLKSLLMAMVLSLTWRILYRIGIYFTHMLTTVYILIIEKKHIKKMSLKEKILSIITWPTFDIIGRYTTYIAIFKKVKWDPIPHKSKMTIDDINVLK